MVKLTEDQKTVFDTLLLMHAEKNPDLEIEDNGLRKAFWIGFKGGRARSPYERGTREFAAWFAGRDARRKSGGRPGVPEEERRRVRTLRLNDARWALFKSLGSGWLERKLDEEQARLRSAG